MLQLFEHIVACLGETCQSPAFAELCRIADEEPVRNISLSPFISYDFRRSGFNFFYDRGESVFERANLFGLPYQELSAYSANLPKDVVISDKKIDVLRKLGKPHSKSSRRRILPNPENLCEATWEDHLILQGAQPLTFHTCSYRQDGYTLQFCFDDDRDGRMTDIILQVSKTT